MIDWKKIEDAFFGEAYFKIKEMFSEYPQKTFYACAFHSTYSDMEVFYPPFLALSSTDSWNDKQLDDNWSAPDWEFPEIDLISNTFMENLMKEVVFEAKRKDTDEHWEQVEKKFNQTILKVVNRLYTEFKKSDHVTKEFVVFYEVVDECEAFLRASLAKNLMSKFFPRLDEAEVERKRIEVLPVKEQAKYYFDALYDYTGLIQSDEVEEKLIALKEDAFPLLVKYLYLEDNGWKYASILGKIGIVTVDVIDALREEVLKQNHSSMWSAKALGLLGDVDFLLNSTENEILREDVLGGLATMYQSWINYCVHPKPLDFKPLEAALERYPFAQKILEENLTTGRGDRTIKKEEIDEALAGLDSSWVLIRQLSVCFLGDRSLGKKDAKRILSALVICLGDKESEIRRLAILSISRWSREALVYIPNIEKLYNDENNEVEKLAFDIVNELSGLVKSK